MRRAERIAAIERGLTVAADEARAGGLILIYGLADVDGRGGGLLGCCVTHALDHAPTFAGRDGRTLPFSSRDICDEFDAIECGWDGVPFMPYSGPVSARSMFPRVHSDFYRMGVRLRRKLEPVAAESVGYPS